MTTLFKSFRGGNKYREFISRYPQGTNEVSRSFRNSQRARLVALIHRKHSARCGLIRQYWARSKIGFTVASLTEIARYMGYFWSLLFYFVSLFSFFSRFPPPFILIFFMLKMCVEICWKGGLSFANTSGIQGAAVINPKAWLSRCSVQLHRPGNPKAKATLGRCPSHSSAFDGRIDFICYLCEP